MLPTLPAVFRIFSRRPSRGTSHVAALVALAAGLLALGPAAPGGSAGDGPVASPDTQLVYGPKRFATPTGSAVYHVERFTLPVRPGQRYLLRVENGAADGTGRVRTAELRLNRATLLTEQDLTGGAVTLALDAAATTTLEV